MGMCWDICYTYIHVLTASAQIVVCSRESDCSAIFLEQSVRSCCEIEDALTFMTTVGAEICEACYSEFELQSSSFAYTT